MCSYSLLLSSAIKNIVINYDLNLITIRFMNVAEILKRNYLSVRNSIMRVSNVNENLNER